MKFITYLGSNEGLLGDSTVVLWRMPSTHLVYLFTGFHTLVEIIERVHNLQTVIEWCSWSVSGGMAHPNHSMSESNGCGKERVNDAVQHF